MDTISQLSLKAIRLVGLSPANDRSHVGEWALKFKLSRTSRHLERYQLRLAIFYMRGFIEQVNFWEARGKLATTVAEDLCAQAKQIIDLIKAD